MFLNTISVNSLLYLAGSQKGHCIISQYSLQILVGQYELALIKPEKERGREREEETERTS